MINYEFLSANVIEALRLTVSVQMVLVEVKWENKHSA